MQLIKFDPFKSLWNDEYFTSSYQGGLDIKETNKEIVVRAVVAGVPAENVEAHMENGVLTIKAQFEEEEKGKNEHKSSSYKYYYTAALSGGDWAKAEAEVKNGILKVSIPKAESAKPRKLTVKAK